MRLANGTVWPIPVILSPADDVAAKINVGQKVALKDPKGRLLGILTVTEKYAHDKALEIPNVYKTEDEAHPGVKIVKGQGNWNIAGPIDVITTTHEPEFSEYRLPPAKTREAFAAKGWSTVAAFQTRNPIHRSHEYLTKCALEMTDGLLIHPLVGETKSDDIPANTRMDCYKVLIDNYYNKDRTMLSVMPLAMRYAGPREAVLHTLIRKNYGDHPFHRRPRSRRRRQLLRHLRRPEDFRSVRHAQGHRRDDPEIRAHRLVQEVRRGGQHQDLPARAGG